MEFLVELEFLGLPLESIYFLLLGTKVINSKSIMDPLLVPSTELKKVLSGDLSQSEIENLDQRILDWLEVNKEG